MSTSHHENDYRLRSFRAPDDLRHKQNLIPNHLTVLGHHIAFDRSSSFWQKIPMITCQRMVMIGAASRNVGKTEFACRLIRNEADRHRVWATKITTVENNHDTCPRGGSGCGVCSSLNDSFCITEEFDRGGDKDTTRMVAAGAEKVLWLRAKKAHLAEGLAQLVSRIPPEVFVVCESNSARLHLTPGLFIVIRKAGSQETKPSCAAVLPWADLEIEFTGQDWDRSPDGITTLPGRWIERPAATAIILAGGGSQRMGRDKGLIPVAGRPLISHVADQLAFLPERIIGSNNQDSYSFLGLKVVRDRQPGLGPLMGLSSCIQEAAHEIGFVTACDIPTLDPEFVMQLVSMARDHDIVMPRLPDGRVEPLFSVYRKSILPIADEVLGRGGRRIVDILDRLRVAFVPFGPPPWYRNLNTPQDLAGFLDGLAATPHRN